MVFVLFDYQFKLNEQLDKQALNLLNKRSEMFTKVINDEFNHQFQLIDSLASLIGNKYDSLNTEDIQHMLYIFDTNNTSQRLVYVNLQGEGITSDGYQINVAEREYFKNTLANGKTIAYIDSSYIDQQKKFVLSVAIYNAEQQPVGLIASIYDAKTFDNVFQNMDYEDYILMCDVDGNVLFSLNEYNPDLIIANIFDYYQSIEDLTPVSEEKIRMDLFLKLSNVIVIGSGTNRHYISYFNIEGTDWIIFTAIPYATVWTQYTDFNFLSVVLIVKMMLAFLLVVFTIYLIEYRKRSEVESERELLRRSEERYRLLDELTGSLIIEGDFINDVLIFSNNYKTVFGYQRITTKISGYLQENPYIYTEDLERLKQYVRDLRNGADTPVLECRIINAQQIPIWCKITAIVLRDNRGTVIGFIGKIVNRDEQIKEINMLKNEVGKDSLTRIDNRAAIELKMNNYLLHQYTHPQICAFFVLDMDDFKQVNDKQGHYIGDQLLIDIAAVMTRLFRQTDIIARLGGDEFGIFMINVPSVMLIDAKAKELSRQITAATKPYNIDNRLSCCIGIAVTYDNAETFRELYKRADKALYQAKKDGKDRYRIDDPHKE